MKITLKYENKIKELENRIHQKDQQIIALQNDKSEIQNNYQQQLKGKNDLINSLENQYQQLLSTYNNQQKEFQEK